MKTIGYVLSQPPSLSETFIGTEMNAMRRLGHVVVPLLLTRPPGESPQDQPELPNAHGINEAHFVPEIVTFLLKRNRWRQALIFLREQTALPPRSLLWNAIKLAALAKRHKCEHLHAHFVDTPAAHAIIAARLAGLTVSMVGHGFDVYVKPADLWLKLRHTDLAIGVCEDMSRDFQRLAELANVHTVHCGVDVDKFQPHTAHTESHKKKLLFIGRLVEKKGLPWLIDALAQIPQELRPQIDIVGDGPLHSSLIAMCKAAGTQDSVHFLGSRTPQWIKNNGPNYVGLVAPFVEAANGDRDSGPIVVKEAMAMGLPVIASRFMGLKEIVDDSCGWLVTPNNTAQLSAAIQELTTSSTQQLAIMGSAGRDRVTKRFNAEASSFALSELIESLSIAS